VTESTPQRNRLVPTSLKTMQPEGSEVALLLSRTEQEQKAAGYFHTLREILQQPATWLQTGEQMISLSAQLRESIDKVYTIVLTGSGSSEYAGECIRLVLQNEISVATEVVGGGVIVTHGVKAILDRKPRLMISLARSGDSPESAHAIAVLLEADPETRHLVFTCNSEGKLATIYRDDPRVSLVVLAEETNDSSLVMTSSFTNLVLAARSLGMLQIPKEYRALIGKISAAAQDLLHSSVDTIASLAQRDFRRVVFLGSGSRLGAARESALKMVEMTAGSVVATCETYLGLRHGPMSAVTPKTLVVCFLSSDPLIRAYECDLIRELNQKKLGYAKLIFGANVPLDLVSGEDVLIECKGLAKIGDENVPVLDVLIGQLLAFFRCLKEGLHPDSPSSSGVISRVVQKFELHGTSCLP
jgi:tagatose-6-phosphate ketose/aldose isomerase